MLGNIREYRERRILIHEVSDCEMVVLRHDQRSDTNIKNPNNSIMVCLIGNWFQTSLDIEMVQSNQPADKV